MIKTTSFPSKKYDHSAIFDMDGLLIDSEPLWYEAANEAFAQFDAQISHSDYARSIGLRTKEFVAYWTQHLKIDSKYTLEIERKINTLVINKIEVKGQPMPGVNYILDLLSNRGFTIGLATSSPAHLIDVVVDKLNIRSYFSVFASAEHLPYGKPHPQVYLDCAENLGQTPSRCICFEDSFNGMIAAKSARMFCVAIPEPASRKEPRFQAADLVLGSLEEFDVDLLGRWGY